MITPSDRTVVTRFAPSPTGLLHAGHAWSALFAYESAIQSGGCFLLRIEDIDFTRCRHEFEAALMEDLHWLGIKWPNPVRRQSEHLSDYAAAARQLDSMRLLYPCFCTRRDIQREIEQAGGAPHSIDGPLYPGTCRRLSDDERQSRIECGEQYAWRLDSHRAMSCVNATLEWTDIAAGTQTARPELFGDVVLVRKDIGCSYHLAVVHDDALQGVTRVTRGMDLFDATHLHRLLQALLNLPTPEYHHHELIRDADGRRLAKRDHAPSIRSIRDRGESAETFIAGLQQQLTTAR
ncbi:MAG: tRNA glutamyl-Q(34) synthetase GluQRS [Planctomycetota bacterium]